MRIFRIFYEIPQNFEQPQEYSFKDWLRLWSHSSGINSAPHRDLIRVILRIFSNVIPGCARYTPGIFLVDFRRTVLGVVTPSSLDYSLWSYLGALSEFSLSLSFSFFFFLSLSLIFLPLSPRLHDSLKIHRWSQIGFFKVGFFRYLQRIGFGHRFLILLQHLCRFF